MSLPRLFIFYKIKKIIFSSGKVSSPNYKRLTYKVKWLLIKFVQEKSKIFKRAFDREETKSLLMVKKKMS